MSQRSAKMNRRIDKIEARCNAQERSNQIIDEFMRDQTQSFMSITQQRNEAQRSAEKAHNAIAGAMTVAGIGIGIAAVLAVWIVADSLTADAAEVQPEHETPQAVEVIPEVEIPEVPEQDENERIEAALLERAHRIDNVKVTHYCCEKYPHICGTGDGITYSGREATPGVSIAVDPDVIPLDSTVMVDYGDGELVYYRADDIGGGVKGNHIDVCMATHQEALNAGIQTVTLYWVEE